MRNKDKLSIVPGRDPVPGTLDAPPMPKLPPERVLLPFGPGPFRMAMALTACPPDELVEIDDRYPAEMAERRDLLATRHTEVFAAEPGTDAARAELLSTLADLLPRRHPTWFERDGAVLRNRLTGEAWDMDRPAHDPLELAGRLVQEDLCLLRLTPDGPVLCAAVLCAPTRWRLAEKIGRPLAAVHGSVPLYADRLAGAVDRFMGALRPGKVVERANWGVSDDGNLFQLSGKHRTALDPSFTRETVRALLFLRVERQTLMRLPASGAVLFTIRVHSYPLARILAIPGAAADLAAALQAMPDSMAAYKSLPPFREALLAHLRDDAAAGPRPA